MNFKIKFIIFSTPFLVLTTVLTLTGNPLMGIIPAIGLIFASIPFGLEAN